MMTNDEHTTFDNDDVARLRRIETTLYLLCRHLGLDPRSGQRLTKIAPHYSNPKPTDR
jgi:hypothetical protein